MHANNSSYRQIADDCLYHNCALLTLPLLCYTRIFLVLIFSLLCVQAHAAEDSQLAKKTLLPLAERMIEKNVKENKMESEAGKAIVCMTVVNGLLIKPPLFLNDWFSSLHCEENC